MSFELNGKSYETDEDGYLLDLDLWSEEVAKFLAEKEDIQMDDKHWEIVNFLREYYREYQIAPAIKILVKEIAARNEMQKKDASAFLYDLFPNGPAVQACKIAGLPKPTGCV
ncbi:MAG: TusE/DsrC/DsvC family sulfur relay protein [Deltaproteobacteria bacterium]|nr:TusE/DsrC/DsvC family sulfur relay protein [Deltaproteobacteria bacterium]